MGCALAARSERACSTAYDASGAGSAAPFTAGSPRKSSSRRRDLGGVGKSRVSSFGRASPKPHRRTATSHWALSGSAGSSRVRSAARSLSSGGQGSDLWRHYKGTTLAPAGRLRRAIEQILHAQHEETVAQGRVPIAHEWLVDAADDLDA